MRRAVVSVLAGIFLALSPTAEAAHGLKVAGWNWPSADGPANACLATDGSGSLTFQDVHTLFSASSPLVYSAGALSIPVSTNSVNGYLSAADHTTFAAKQNALTFGNLTSSTTGLAVSGGTGAVIGAGAALSIQNAATGQPGLLTAADWNTFNGKQAAGNYITALTSDVSAFGPGSVAATVNSVGGSSAANVHTAELAANAATNLNTVSTIVKRDGSGNFAAGTMTGSLTGAASLNVLSSALGNLTDAGTDGITVTGGTGATVGSPSLSQHVADATHNGYLSSTDWGTFNSKGSGSVTGVSVATANGFAGSSSGGATPALTLSTSITGLLKGNGTAISAATSGTDYVVPSGSITGTSANVTGTVAIANGGTGQTAAAAAFDALAPTTTKGDLITRSSTGGMRRAVGADGTVLTADSAQTSGLNWTSPLTNPMDAAGQMIYGGTAGAVTKVPAGTSGQVPISAGTSVAFGTLPGNATALKAPTTQAFTSGTSLTYTTPTNPSPLYIEVLAVGPGGGGGSGGTGGGAGTAGTASTAFGSAISAGAGGGGGSAAGQNGGTGGTPTLTTSSTVLKVVSVAGGGGGGGSAQANQSGGGTGGNSCLGGAGTTTINSAGGNAASNSGGGGGGASNVNGGAGPGGGGGAGACIRAILTSPSGTYTYTVGGAGSAGTGGAANGGAGSAGYIEVTEHYQ